jgi:chorismate-pyruvate lyase
VSLAAALLLAGCAGHRLPRFEAVLAANESATVALEQWCTTRRFADPARVIADTVAGGPAEPADARALLGIDGASALGFRHVRLSCGGRVLSEAYNWYVPSRLTPAMNDTLERTRTPFGKVAAPLAFRRERLATRRGAALGCPAGTVLSHRALLRLPDGHPLALLVECYSTANLGG